MSRVQNRLREHTREGHMLYNEFPHESIFQPGNLLFNCTCGWQGWLPKDIL